MPARLHIHPRVPKMIGVQPSPQFAAALAGTRFHVPSAFSGTDTPVCALPFTDPAIGSRALVPPASHRLAVEGRGFIPTARPAPDRASAPEAVLRAPSSERQASASAKISNSKPYRLATHLNHSKQRTSQFSNSQLLAFFCKIPFSTLQSTDNAMIQKAFLAFSKRFQPSGGAW
jgi:hypothetical protein